MRTLYFNGDIITMANQPMPQAVLTENGVIIATGQYEILLGKADRLYDLNGKTMLPAFIDSHSHFTTVANTLAIANLSKADSIEDISDILSAFITNKGDIEPDEFIVGFGYDNNLFENKKHPTKNDLDKICPDHPVLISHARGHMGVANTKALGIMGIDKNIPDPTGGFIGRNADGSPNGYLEETAFTANASFVKQPDFVTMVKLMHQAQHLYFKYGISTVQDGFTGYKEWNLLKRMSDKNLLTADVVAYIDINSCPEIPENNKEYKNYINNLKIGGYKLFLDGSPQGRTAWMTKPYKDSKDYCGYPVYSDDDVLNFVKKSVTQKQQLMCHCNGDAAAEQFITAYDKAHKQLNTGHNCRPMLVHGQLATPQQMEKAASIGMIVSFFVSHIWQWGYTHIENFSDRAMKICPVNSANKYGAVTTFHQDSPVLPPDMLQSVWCAVNRITKDGIHLDKGECITVYDALKAVTINAAYQYGEEHKKGSIQQGKDASFVILSENPLLCDKKDINKIKVDATIIKDKIVYSR